LLFFIFIKLGNWPVSDDTILHLAVAENLCENKNLSPGMHKNYLYNKRIRIY
jgi:ADP-ribosylglycohydrolase